MTSTSDFLQLLENRKLFAQFGLDTSFGEAGYAPVAADVFLSPLPDGKILTALNAANPNLPKDELTLLDAKGQVDDSFNDAGSPAGAIDAAIMISDQRVYIAGITNAEG